MEDVILNGQARTVTGKQVRQLRRAGLLPAVIYGHKVEPVVISINQRDADRILPRLSASQLLSIEIDGVKHTVLVREKQRNPITGAMIHLDFQEISMTEKIGVVVRVNLKGEAPAVKLYGAIVVPSREELEVEALPRDLPSSIDVDITVLKEIGDAIYVRDLNLPSTVTILAHMDDVIAVVAPPAAELEAEEGEEAEPEVIEKGKKEEDEE